MRSLLLDTVSWNMANPPTPELRRRFDPEAGMPSSASLPLPASTGLGREEPGVVDSDSSGEALGTPGSAAEAAAASSVRPVDGVIPRVAIVISNYDGVVDGVTLTLNDLVEWLEVRGVPTLVLTVDYEDEGEFGSRVKGSNIVRLPGQRIFPCSTYKYRTLFSVPEEAFDSLRAFRPTVVHAASPCSLCKAVLEWARDEGIARVGTFHTDFAAYMQYHGFITGLLEPAVWWGLRWFNSACTRVYAPTVTMVRRLVEHDVGLAAHRYDILADRICVGADVAPELEEAAAAAQQPLLGVWGRGADLQLFSPTRRSEAWRAARGVEQGEVLIVTVGRLVREKNLTTLAGIATLLQQAGAPARLVVVGDGPERASLAAACPDTVSFTGALYGEELATAYASADIFLFASDTETFGRVNVEAMASGLPVVAAGAGGTLDIVREGQDGFLCDARDPAAFLPPLLRLVTEPQLRRRMADSALQRARVFDWERLFSGMLQEYKVMTATHCIPERGGGLPSTPSDAPLLRPGESHLQSLGQELVRVAAEPKTAPAPTPFMEAAACIV